MKNIDEEMDIFEKHGGNANAFVAKLYQEANRSDMEKLEELNKTIQSAKEEKRKMIRKIVEATGLIEGKPKHALVRAGLYNLLEDKV